MVPVPAGFDRSNTGSGRIQIYGSGRPLDNTLALTRGMPYVRTMSVLLLLLSRFSSGGPRLAASTNAFPVMLLWRLDSGEPAWNCTRLVPANTPSGGPAVWKGFVCHYRQLPPNEFQD